ncbi:MAG: chorismate-binding protein, partial [Gammaproteobacteria bacterium]|nr:chorismate-binding protein [Gammaproteobacteria bacterium]
MSAEPDCATISQRLSGKPDLLGLHAANPSRYPFLLESAAHGTDPNGAASAQARYDILFAFPGETLKLGGDGVLSGSHPNAAESFLDGLDQWTNAEHIASSESVLPFSGGWFLYFAYELACELEPGINIPLCNSQPIAIATRIPAAIIHDRFASEYWAVAEKPDAELLGELVNDAAITAVDLLDTDMNTASAELLVEEAAAEDFISAVNSAKQHIAAGDIYQANLSRQWRAKGCQKPAWKLYKQLRAANPAPYAGLAVFGKEQGLPA